MRETLIEKIKRWLYLKTSDICGHKYGCCNNAFRKCKKCGYYTDLEIQRLEEYERGRE